LSTPSRVMSIEVAPPMLIDRPGAAAQIGLDDLALGEIGVPMFLGVDRRLLAERREGDLAAAILDPLAPGLFGDEAGRDSEASNAVEDRLLLGIVEQLGIDGVQTLS
jgi:hypothetical protein